MKYEKQPIDISEQIQRLQSRGLDIADVGMARQYLNNISYYRLRAYTYPFQNNQEESNHEFLKNGITFQDIIGLYCFDSKLRSLLFRAIETIEIAWRTRIVLVYSTNEGNGFWFLDEKLCHQREKISNACSNTESAGYKVIEELRREVQRSNEEFISHYHKKYCSPPLPPAWMTLEVVSMGTLSKLFAALDKKNESNKAICKEFGLYKVEILRNWMHALSSLRNICAHHGRVWNRRFTIALSFPRRTEYPFLLEKEVRSMRDNKLFAYLSVILYLLRIVGTDVPFAQELLNLLECRPNLVSLKEMGFPADWQQYTLWKDYI